MAKFAGIALVLTYLYSFDSMKFLKLRLEL